MSAHAQHYSGTAQGYSGKIRADVDHEALKPAAWRVDSYLDGDEDVSLASLRGHRLAFRTAPKDAMARSDNVDDLMVQTLFTYHGEQSPSTSDVAYLGLQSSCLLVL